MLTVSQASALLQTFDNILILTHVRPDGDTVGCAAALCAGLRQLGKRAYLLPNPELTRSTAPYFAPYAAPDNFVAERIVSVDIAALSLLPENAQPYASRIDLALDHHPSFEGFGKANLVRPEAAACAELLYEILGLLCPLTAEIALPLYVGLSTDTGCFVYTNTTANTHAVAAALLAIGIDYRSVNKIFFRTKSRKRMMLEGAMLDGMEFYDQGRVVLLSVPLSLMKRVDADESDAEELSSLGGMIEGTDCAVTFRELQGGTWKLSVRTGERINATEVCQLLGGGGHAAAAGCTIHGDFAGAKAQILQAIAQIAGN